MEGIEELKAAIRGNVVLSQENGSFSAGTRVWAVSPNHKSLPTPAVVVQPRGTADVVAAVKFATSKGLPLAVRGGGHGGGNPSLADGGVTIDLSLMRSVYVDPKAKTAVIDGGALACEIDAETALHGLACPLGVCSVVGMGLALNGGLSLLSRAVGPACDHILEAQIVLADGSVVDVSEESQPDLLWAIRGAGSTLGVVTKLKMRLHEAPTYSGAFVWQDDPAHANFKAILRWVRDTVIPDPTIGFNCGRMMHPEQGPLLISMCVIVGVRSVEEKDAILKPLRELGPLQDTVGKSSWLQTQLTHYEGVTGLKQAFPVHYESWTGGHLKEEQFTEEFMDAYIAGVADQLPLPDLALSMSVFELMGGKIAESSGPVGFANGALQWVMQAGWADPALNDKGIAYTSHLKATLGPKCDSMGKYVNLLDVAEPATFSYAEAAEKVGGPANFERLKAIKRKYDPQNVFSSTPFKQVLPVEAN